MMLSVPVSIVMSGAAIEASANETIQDILDGGTGLPVPNSRKLLLQDLKSDRAGTAIDRYRRLALLFDREPDTGTAAWDNAKLLVSFRNSFMHFKPAWDHEKDIHEGALVGRLKTKIPIYRAYASNFQFPYGFMTYGCAKWAVESVLAFSASFTALLRVKDRFIGTHSRLLSALNVVHLLLLNAFAHETQDEVRERRRLIKQEFYVECVLRCRTTRSQSPKRPKKMTIAPKAKRFRIVCFPLHSVK